MNLTQLSLLRTREALDNGEFSAVELTSACIQLAKANTSNAFITLTEEQAVTAAQAAQKLIEAGESTALTGIPCTLKDNICTAEVPTTCGSEMLRDFKPYYNAAVVDELDKLGAVVIGKTNMDEFAMGNSSRTSAFGAVKNPLDSARVAGGSSSGSAAAVADGSCVFSLGTDTGGSIRQPSAFCGVVGLKPTYERISRKGVVAFSGSFDTVGPIGRTAMDCAVVMDALTGTDCVSRLSMGVDAVRGKRIAIVTELMSDLVSDEVAEAVHYIVKILKNMGCSVTEVSLPILQYSAPAYIAISCAEAVSALSRYDGIKYGLRGNGNGYEEMLRDSRTRGFGEEVKRRLLLGNYVLSGANMTELFDKSVAIKQQTERDFCGVFADCDVVISPTTTRLAFGVEEPYDAATAYASMICTTPMSLAGLPCANAPCRGLGGMPIGISVTGNKFDDATVLQVANVIEQIGSPFSIEQYSGAAQSGGAV